MARYFLHLHNRIGVVPDEEGAELPDVDAARQLARGSIRGMIGDEAKSGRIDLHAHIEIADETGRVLTVVPFAEAVEIRLDEESS